MPEWLTESFHSGPEITFGLLTARLALSFLLGCVVAAVYHFSQRSDRRNGLSMAATLLLLCILIAMVTQVIGNSVARAFSLVGALAIVRFRTVVEDTRDTAFVIFAVVVGMAVGAGEALVALVGIPFVAAAAFLLRPNAPLAAEGWNGLLEVRLALGHAPETSLAPILSQHLDGFRLLRMATARQGSAMDCIYQIRLRLQTDLGGLVAALNQVPGVQQVEVRRD